jgi:hypothetical protein
VQLLVLFVFGLRARGNRDILPFIRLLSRLISPLLFIYYLSILVEVLLRLLTYRGDLVLLYLVSEDHS